jgi:hypothetical protein
MESQNFAPQRHQITANSPIQSALEAVLDRRQTRRRLSHLMVSERRGASWSFHRWMTVFASARTALSAALTSAKRAGPRSRGPVVSLGMILPGCLSCGKRESSGRARSSLLRRPSNDLPAAEIFGQGRGRRIIIVTAKCLKFSLDRPIIILERVEAFLNLAQQGF